MNIRLMTTDDYDQLYAMWSSTPGMGLHAVEDSREGIAKYLARNPTTSFVAEQGGRIVGAIMAGHDGRRGFISHTAVLPEHRREGTARRLVEAAMAALEKEGIRKTALVAYKTNETGNTFWESMGFFVREDLYYRNRDVVTD